MGVSFWRTRSSVMVLAILTRVREIGIADLSRHWRVETGELILAVTRLERFGMGGISPRWWARFADLTLVDDLSAFDRYWHLHAPHRID